MSISPFYSGPYEQARFPVRKEPREPQPPRKLWPSDAVMIVAAHEGTELVANMESRVACVCCDCSKPLMADTATIRRSVEAGYPRGRPIRFFCVECCVTYDRTSVDVLEDHRRPSPANT